MFRGVGFRGFESFFGPEGLGFRGRESFESLEVSDVFTTTLAGLIWAFK